MISAKHIKVAFLGAFTLFFFIWLIAGTFSRAATGTTSENQTVTTSATPTPNPADYVGAETCRACHEDQFNSVAQTKHGKLHQVESWKGKIQNCESCHGPGKAHSEEPSVTNIISFKNKDPKFIADTCLACHAGKEEHNQFRRGEHWRNNVGCTDCHTAHGPEHGKFKDGSMTLANRASTLNPAPAMLKNTEQQLCISCHSEVKSHFNKPFRHKVMEGAMKCSDCHNPHGGFETKQTKLAVGADVACVKCHTDKQGPFVFEHAPMSIEGCSACHTPHGSANPKMLKRHQVRQLCLECHSGITNQLSDSPLGGPHDQRNLRSRNCTVCHTAIHGSNAHPAFFR
ncbi:MAG TPA: DmsE family decaheme c-type cytochrome [Pyrinomonadaceae bacterium]|nr:DmsE family decaheme c-type cytochrome [Pyrinomonadaceae bacterium]